MTRAPRCVVAVCGLVALAATALPAQESIADSLRKYKFLGKTARDKGDHADAVRYYETLSTFDPEYHPAHYYAARAHLALGAQDAAKAALLRAVEIKPRHGNTNLLLFQVFAGQSKPDSAWTFLRPVLRAHQGDPKYVEYHRTVADLYRLAGQDSVAIGHYETIVGSTPDSLRAPLYELLAQLHGGLGNTEQALGWWQKMGVTVEALTKMVDLQIQTREYQAAFGTLQTLAGIDSAGRYSHFVRISELGETAADPAMRMSGLEGMARSQPQDLETIATIAQLHLNDDNLEAAGSWLSRGLGKAPEDAHLRVINGDLLHEKQASEDDVIAEYEIALEDPNWASVAQQRIWQIRPPKTEEEKLREQFFGGGGDSDSSN